VTPPPFSAISSRGWCRRLRTAPPVAVDDVAATVAWLASREISDEAVKAVAWDLMQPQKISLSGVIDQFRFAFGTAAMRRVQLPSFMIDLGAGLDLVNRLGWMPPIRTTAIAELRRGVTGDPRPWMTATGIVPKTIAQMIGQRPATIQDKWFARLFLVKALVVASLVAFWIVSGLIALLVSCHAAAGILSSHGFLVRLVAPITIGASLMDSGIGVLIAFRRTSATGLVAGIVASLGDMAGSAILTPDLWIERTGCAGQDRARDRAKAGGAIDAG
jgi:hypothetical protein